MSCNMEFICITLLHKEDNNQYNSIEDKKEMQAVILCIVTALLLGENPYFAIKLN